MGTQYLTQYEGGQTPDHISSAERHSKYHVSVSYQIELVDQFPFGRPNGTRPGSIVHRFHFHVYVVLLIILTHAMANTRNFSTKISMNTSSRLPLFRYITRTPPRSVEPRDIYKNHPKVMNTCIPKRRPSVWETPDKGFKRTNNLLRT